MCEPTDDWSCKLDEVPEMERSVMNTSSDLALQNGTVSGKAENEFSFPCGSLAAEDDDEVTESKIRAFLDEKVPILVIFVLHMYLQKFIIDGWNTE